MRCIIALSGPIAVGKSAVIDELKERYGAVRVSTRELIQRLKPGVPSEREPLQEAGDELDRATDGAWVAIELQKWMKDLAQKDLAQDAIVVVDSVRIAKQVEHLKKQFNELVHHVHLTASDEELVARFEARKATCDANVRDPRSYEEARKNSTEAQIEQLGTIADQYVQTDHIQAPCVTTLAVRDLGLYPKEITPLVDVVVGGQYGSEGKGNICDYLAERYDVLVRVGGPNAGHRVANPPYDYIHMPSGTNGNPDAAILIGAGATLSLDVVLREIEDLKLTPARLSIDPQAMIIEPSDIDYEKLLGDRIGSTKQGVGAATARKILGRDGEKHLDSVVRLAKHIESLKPFVRSVTAELEKAYLAGKLILLEGTQGTDLSIHHAFYPNVTSRETTVAGCLADAGISPRRVRKIYMVTRTYPIRVGGESGEMGIEVTAQIIADRSGLEVSSIQKTEVGTISKKPRRMAEFSWERVRRAAQLNGATDIVLTFADYCSSENRGVRTFEGLTVDTKEMIKTLEEVTGITVSIVSVGFGRASIIDTSLEKRK
jgi:adenylosuccinate synthase